MLGLLFMVNPIWQVVVAPLILLTIGYYARPRVEAWLARMDEIDRINRRFRPPASHVRRVEDNGDDGPYDWSAEEPLGQN